ncbi:MAG: nucleoside transporter C-terminal domain-containing protein [Gammaproteobacteria bacterium]|nr:nucleoside transporter C-terminal domain-containing protein [Gammaproteobacteria bacterium]
MSHFQGIIGLLGLTAIAWALSEERHSIRWRVPLIGFGLQFAIALVMLKLPASQAVFAVLNDGVVALQNATEAGTSFVFGYLGGGPLPFEETETGGSLIFAFRSLPLVIVISALTALLNYWRILPLIINTLSRLLERSLNVGGAVALSAAANVFVGMVEAPLFIRRYLLQISRAELFMVMACGMATIAGTVLVLYTTLLAPILDDAVGHLLTASIISAPAAIMFAWLMVPLKGAATGTGRLRSVVSDATSTMDAITRGTERGLQLFLSIIAMLLVLVALVQLANAVLGLLPAVGGDDLSLQRMLGWLFAPIAWSLGVPWAEAGAAGGLLGIKTALNEFLAYLAMSELPSGTLSERSTLIMSYALCGMANLGSLGIMIGGFTVMVPERRREVVSLGVKSIVAGTLATCSTGAVVGLIVW